MNILNSVRLTWRVTLTSQKLVKGLAKRTGLTQDEVANIIMENADIEALTPKFQQHVAQKRAEERRKEVASSKVSSLSPSALERLSKMSSEDLEKALGGGE